MQASFGRRVAAGLVLGCMVLGASAAWGDTVAYWRFEEGPAGAKVAHGGQPDGAFFPGVADSSGHGNALSSWTEADFAGYAYRTNRPATSIPQTGATNNFAVQNTGDVPGMFTQTGSMMQTMTPAAFTIEASFMPEEHNHHRTIVGRDSFGAATTNANLAALYLQVQPDESVAIKFADVSGYWHEAISLPGAVQGFNFPDVAQGHWYHIAAISDGSTLSLYLNDVDAGTGYQLIAHTDMTLSGSPNTALTAGAGDGGDWDAGNWTVGRGIYGGGHGDRAYGLIDEVRISDAALPVGDLLFVPEPTSLAALGILAAMFLKRRSRQS